MTVAPGLLQNDTTHEEDALFSVTDLFLANYHSTAEVVVNQGGTSSGKTYAIIQVLFTIAIYEPGVKITVTSEDVPALKKGAYRNAEDLFRESPFIQYHLKEWNKTDRKFTFKNNSFIEFTTYDSQLDAHQGKRDYLFVNEANTVPYAIVEQLMLRTEVRTFIDYNPTVRFWAHTELIGKPFVEHLISDHRDNPFLSDSKRRKIENQRDDNNHRVYARGLTGNVEGLIYPNWVEIQDDEYPWKDERPFVGLDFGYSVDPTAGVRLVLQGDRLFAHEMFYEPGLPAEVIKQKLDENGLVKTEAPIYCDHDPSMISELRRLELPALNANKKPGSLRNGILALQDIQVFYTASSKNIKSEVISYEWDTNEATGKLMNVPKGDKEDHLLDAIRYGYYTHKFRPE